MNRLNNTLIVLMLLLFSSLTYADDTLELDTTIIKDNKEAPQILYMVPWEETKGSTKREEHKLVLHSLFGDLFDPVLPEQAGSSDQ